MLTEVYDTIDVGFSNHSKKRVFEKPPIHLGTGVDTNSRTLNRARKREGKRNDGEKKLTTKISNYRICLGVQVVISDYEREPLLPSPFLRRGNRRRRDSHSFSRLKGGWFTLIRGSTLGEQKSFNLSSSV